MQLSIKKSASTLVMIVIGLFFLFPFFWMISASLKQETDVFNFPIEWIPKHWNAVQNYTQVWVETPFARYYGNSIVVSVITTALSVLVSCLASYGFTKVQFKGREAIFLILLVVYMIPHQAILVPQFIIYRMLGLYDTLTGLILLNSFSVLGTFLLRQAFLSINNEFMESARMDGAGHVRIFK